MKVTYWATASLEPEFEAVSKEIFDLAGQFESRIFSINPHLRARIARRGRVLGFHPALDHLLRPAIRCIERGTAVNHVYGEMAPWIYFKTLRRRPIVLTIASEKGEVVPEFLQRCRVIAVQTIGMEKRLEEFGSDECRVQLVYPGIDLTAFRPRPRTAHARRPKVLLATFPRSTEELDSRGVRFLLSAAAALPDVDFILLTRPWRSGGTAAAQVGQEIESAGLRNVTLLSGTQTDMNKVYSGADFTIIPYTAPDGGKECPRSLIESMACGVPVLISDVAPFSRFVEAQDCGAVFRLQPEALGAALERGLQRYEHVSARAVTCAGSFFNIHATFERYAKIYDSVT